MWLLRSILLHLSVCWFVSGTDRLDFHKGEVCKQTETGQLWTCKSLGDCPKAQEGQKKGDNTTQTCNSEASDTVVCCEPDIQPAVVGAKSKNMCKQYAESVYKMVPDPVTGDLVKIDTCKVTESLISILDETGNYPHMAMIGYGNKTNPQWACSGTLISERYVLTVAHCLQPHSHIREATLVRLGEHLEDTKNKWVDYEILVKIIHPDYKQPELSNDIGLLKLNKDVEFTEYIRPICLQTDYQFPNTRVTAVGWDRIRDEDKQRSYLYKSYVHIISRKQCTDDYSQLLNTRNLKDGIEDKSMVCAGENTNEEEAICNRLSGTPLLLELKEPYCMFSQVAITSFGTYCGAGNPTVYTRVSHFVPWIESIVWS